MFAEDMDAFFDTDEHAVSASWSPSNGAAAQTAGVFLDMPDEIILGGGMTSTEYAITYAATKLTGLAEGESLTIEGVDYKVRSAPRRIEDGKMMRAMLSRY